ncbi:MAG: hypothetical protein M1833_005610 [Piccolia ochrophora]|nr:MAG: hypothetical protein M1833_005610 [Piccolia ochrophora]
MPRLRASWALMASVAIVAAQSGEMEMLLDDELDPLFPRFRFGTLPRLGKRQALSECEAGESPCNAVNGTGCCPNDNYCYVDRRGNTKCCDEGSRCDDPCPISAYHCTVSRTTSCCPRRCPAPSAFQCEEDLGGACCSVGSICLEGRSCSPTVNPSTVNTVTPSTSPTGCTADQFSCPASIGGGCCDNGQACTNVGQKLYCAGGGIASNTARTGNDDAFPTATEISSTSSSEGLSVGARAGVGVGVALVCVALLVSLVFFILSRRRKRRSLERTTSSSSRHLGQDDTAHGSPAPAAMTQPDYFGPSARPGPFTYSDAADRSGLTPLSPARGAVPLNPQSPGDITTPVEIAESEGQRSPGDVSLRTDGGQQSPGSIQRTPNSMGGGAAGVATPPEKEYFPPIATPRGENDEKKDTSFRVELP